MDCISNSTKTQMHTDTYLRHVGGMVPTPLLSPLTGHAK